MVALSLSRPVPRSGTCAWTTIAATAMLLAVACGDSTAADRMLRVADIEPNYATIGQSITVSIRGGGFAVRVGVSYANAGSSTVDAGYRAWLSDVELTNVVRLTETALSAVVPEALLLGSHDLLLESPWGENTTRPGAFQVVDGITGPCSGNADCRDTCHTSALCVDGTCDPGPLDLDADGDGYVADTCFGGTDCNDSDVDNWLSCDTCVDSDSDGVFVGCDAYTQRAGPDCDDHNDDRTGICP